MLSHKYFFIFFILLLSILMVPLYNYRYYFSEYTENFNVN